MWGIHILHSELASAGIMEYQVVSRPPLKEEARTRDRLEIVQFAEFVGKRWIAVVLACSVAVALALAGSLLASKKYTATASLLIEPPAGNDPRGATAISPIYLESLKTYERFAASDSLFANALDQLNLRQRYATTSIEALKKKVLRVNKPRETKILEISATLPNPRDAQALAKHLAEETVRLSGSLDQQSQRDLTEQVRAQLEVATTRVQQAEKSRNEFLASDPVETLEAEIRNGTEQKLRLQGELVEARIDLVDYEARMQSRAGSESDPRDAATMREQLAASRARTVRMEKEDHDLGQLLTTKGLLLEKRKHRREILDIERQAARAQYESAASKNNDTLASAAFRSERLEIVDPGTVPEQPSSPNIPLNLIVAFFAALVSSFFYLAFQYSWSRLGRISGAKAYLASE